MNAMQAVERGVPLRRAAVLYNIPRSTLHDHVSGKVEFQARSGPRSGVPLSLARASATDPEMLNRYYDTLEHSLRENDLFNKPGIIFNCDETGLALNPAAPRVVQEVGVKNPNFITAYTINSFSMYQCFWLCYPPLYNI